MSRLSDNTVNIQQYTGELHIINNGSLITYTKDASVDFVIHFAKESEVNIKLVFTYDTAGKKGLHRAYNADTSTIQFTCTNFNNPLGTGTSEAIKILTYKKQALYMHFWVFQLGNTALKRVDYTFYLESAKNV